jgi:hypothetical protein
MKELWERAIKATLEVDNQLILPQKYILGEWYEQVINFWEWWASTDDTERLVCRTQNLFKVYNKASIGRSTRRSKYTLAQETLEVDLSRFYPVSVSIKEGYVLINSIGTITHDCHLPRTVEGTKDWVHQYLTASKSSLIRLAQQIQHGLAEIVSDGSFQSQRSSSAFVSVHDHSLCGGNKVIGSQWCQSAYRGELAGILSIIVLVSKVAKQYKINTGSVTIGCDCMGAIKAVERRDRVSVRWHNFDILRRIQYETRATPVKFYFHKIKAHQDDIRAYNELDRWEQANVLADRLAKEFLQDPSQSIMNPHPDDHAARPYGWTLEINNTPIGNNIRERITEHIWSFKGKQFWCKKLRINPAMTQYIWWDVISAVGNNLPIHKRQRYIKIMSNIAPVGSILHQRDEANPASCPLCGLRETNTHLWTCQNDEIRKIYEEEMIKINAWVNTGPVSFGKFLTETLYQIRSGHELNDQQQIQIPHIGTLWGFYHCSWIPIFNEYNKNSRISPTFWLATLTIKLWSLWDTLWEYRNEFKHRPQGTKEEQEQLDKQIEEIYERIPDLRMLTPTERRFFVTTAQARKTHTIRRKRKWLRDATVILLRFQSMADKSSSVRLFRQYFSAK